MAAMAMYLDMVGHRGEPHQRGWLPRDCTLYALSVGAGFDDLAFVGEKAAGHPQQVYPSFVCSGGRSDKASSGEGNPMFRFGDYQVHQLVHGEQELTIHGEIGPTGSVISTSTVVGIYDKGSGAVVHAASESVDAATGEPLFTTGSKLFVMGEGGFGGDPGPKTPDWDVGDAPPDTAVDWQTLPVQSLLYRHGGNDPNLIHYDPAVAGAAFAVAPRQREVDVDAVGNDAVLAAVGPVDEVSRRLRHGDLAVQLALQPPDERPRGVIDERRLPRRVERADIQRLGVAQHGKRQGRHQRLLQMDHVELALVQEAPHARQQRRRQRESGRRLIHRKRHDAATDPVEVGILHLGRLRR